MTDEYFTKFLEGKGFAPALGCGPVDEETLNHYRGKLPDHLLDYWEEFGFCRYGEGIFWTVNPADYAFKARINYSLHRLGANICSSVL